jgi:hypothetical protein
MKAWITAIILFLGAASARGQDDDTIKYVHGLPVTGEDTLQQVPPDDVAPVDSIVQLSAEQIPRELFRELNENPLYKGWQNHTLQIDKNTGLYWLHIRDRETVRSYGFNRDGKPVSVREKSIPAEK